VFFGHRVGVTDIKNTFDKNHEMKLELQNCVIVIPIKELYKIQYEQVSLQKYDNIKLHNSAQSVSAFAPT
jgi:hypothetical protein